MDKETLESQILYYATKYYEGNPEISDDQFDMLVDNLRKLDPNSKVLNTGWGFEVIDDKVKHKYSHIGSLEKAKSFEEIPDRFKNKTIFLSPKLDGLSAVAYYVNGRLVKGVTRGNGEYGKNITSKLLQILGSSISDTSFTGSVRGELIISNANWEKLQQKYDKLISPRNFAAGIINRKDIDSDLKYIDMVMYKIVGQENKNIYKHRDEVLRWLSLNFEHCVPNYFYPVLNLVSWDTYHKDTFEEFKKLGYGLDGLVLTQNDVIYNEMTNGYQYDEVAFKFPAEKTTTMIKDIEWELSRTQRLVPIALVEPVELSGAVIERATCNNAKWVVDMQLGKDTMVEITRSNEVIPKILSVIEMGKVELPTKCPICGSSLEWEGVDLKCPNTFCPNIELSDLRQWCETIGETDGLQWTLMKQYLDVFGIQSIDELYLEEKYVKNILDTKKLSITDEKIKLFFTKIYDAVINIDTLLMALNIPRVGEKTACELGKHTDICYDLFLYVFNQELFDEYTTNELRKKVYGIVKEATTASIFNNIDKLRHAKYVLVCPFKRVNFATSNNSDIKYVAVTGALETMKRKDFEKYIKQYGYELSSSIKKCEYLITNNPNSGSSKNKQAKQFGIPIVTEKEFLDKLS